MSDIQIDLAQFKLRIIDGFIVLWDIGKGRWHRCHKVDGLDGLRNGSYLMDDPAGSRPDAALLESAFRDRATAQRIAAAYK